MDSGDTLIGLGPAILIIPLIVAHLKPALAPLFRRFTSDPPWELIADLVGIAWTVGLWRSGLGPAWLAGWATCILAGFALGVAAGKAYDVTQAAREAIVPKATESGPTGYVEPGTPEVPKSTP